MVCIAPFAVAPEVEPVPGRRAGAACEAAPLGFVAQEHSLAAVRARHHREQLLADGRRLALEGLEPGKVRARMPRRGGQTREIEHRRFLPRVGELGAALADLDREACVEARERLATMALVDGRQRGIEDAAAPRFHVAHGVGHAAEQFRRGRAGVEPTACALGLDDGAVVGEEGAAVVLPRLQCRGKVEPRLGRQGALAAFDRIRHPAVSVIPRARPGGHYRVGVRRDASVAGAPKKSPLAGAFLRLVGVDAVNSGTTP